MNYIEEKVGEFRGFLTPSSQKEHEQITKLCEYFKTTLQEVDRRAREERDTYWKEKIEQLEKLAEREKDWAVHDATSKLQ